MNIILYMKILTPSRAASTIPRQIFSAEPCRDIFGLFVDSFKPHFKWRDLSLLLPKHVVQLVQFDIFGHDG